MSQLKEGVSVIICCYNSGWIIDRTLNALKQQRFSHDISWEIILVDNCCTDDTIDIAKREMAESPIPFFIVKEDNAGLANARRKGISEAHYDIVIYCDDDNMLCENYVDTMNGIMRSDDNIGASGGMGIAEYQTTPAKLVKENPGAYAVGSQKDHDCWLFGAGVTLRTTLVREVYNTQHCYLMGRQGGELLSGDDSELVMSMVLRGYKIAPTDDVTFIHVLKANRLTADYYKKLLVGLERPFPVFEVYRMVIKGESFKLLLNKYYMLYRAYLGSYIHFTRPTAKETRKHYGEILSRYQYWGIFTLWKIYREWEGIKKKYEAKYRPHDIK